MITYAVSYWTTNSPKNKSDGEMWRAFFMGVGISLIVLGVECLVVERAVIASPAAVNSFGPSDYESAEFAASTKVIEPPDWAPWSLISAGVIITLYATTFKGGG